MMLTIAWNKQEVEHSKNIAGLGKKKAQSLTTTATLAWVHSVLHAQGQSLSQGSENWEDRVKNTAGSVLICLPFIYWFSGPSI